MYGEINAFDFDNCLVKTAQNARDIVALNQALLMRLQQEAQEFSKIILTMPFTSDAGGSIYCPTPSRRGV